MTPCLRVSSVEVAVLSNLVHIVSFSVAIDNISLIGNSSCERYGNHFAIYSICCVSSSFNFP